MVSQLHVKRRRGPFQHRPSKVDNKNKNVYVQRQSDNVLFQLSGQDDLKNMISPSSSNSNQNDKYMSVVSAFLYLIESTSHG